MDSLIAREQAVANKEIALRLYENRLNALWDKIKTKKDELDQQELDIAHKLHKLEALQNNNQL